MEKLVALLLQHFHGFRSFFADGPREWSTYAGAALLGVAVLLALVVPSNMLNEWHARLTAANGLLGTLLLLWRQRTGGDGGEGG